MQQKQAAISFLQMAAQGKVREAYDRFISPDFRHHNQFFKGDRHSLMVAMEENAQKHPNKTLEVKKLLEDGDTVMTLSHVKQDPNASGGAVVHIFRFEKGKIAELWDLGQEIMANSMNENGVF
jgi:predicted SnoaL-like aldol condensation-catalyzing enzyme